MEQKKQLIMQAASQVFSTEGFHKAKITKIAELAGVGAGTVYLYFKNKENILEELFIKAWSSIEKKLLELNSIDNLSPKEKLSELIKEIIHLVAQNTDIAKIILHEYSFWSKGPSTIVNSVVEATVKLMTDIIDEVMTKTASKMNPRRAAYFFIGGIWSLLANAEGEFTDEVCSSLVKDIEKLFFNGLS